MPLPRRTTLLLTSLALAAGTALWVQSRRPTGKPAPASNRPTDVTEAFLALEASESAAETRDFARELAAAPALDALNDLWDRLNQDPEPLLNLADLAPATLRFEPPAKPSASIPLPDGIQPLSLAPGTTWQSTEWSRQLAAWHAAGWRLRRSRWQLLDWVELPPRNRFSAELLLEHEPTRRRTRIAVEGSIEGAGGILGPGAHVTLDRLEGAATVDTPPIGIAAELVLPVPPHSAFCDPLIAVRRSDGTGDDLLLIGAGIWLRANPGGWEVESFPGLPPEPVWAAAVVDWNRDQVPDLLLAGREGVRWLPGPRWEGPGTLLWRAPVPIRHPQSLAASDYDGDGDIDLFLTQYKLPYQGGQFPTPFHDANDGFESFLLRNEGPAGLRDFTLGAGLAGKRRRRTYSASFADWNGDGQPDLIVNSDFAGVDLFLNQGNGTFSDETRSLGDARHLFGMAHVTGDFNDDGRPDLYAIGMGSPVAARLDRWGLARPGFESDRRLRPAMTAGNRMFLGVSGGMTVAPSGMGLSDGGWAWAATPIDVDNDGRLDLHVCHGHETRASVRDYERQFWLHDLHVAASTHNPVTDLYFRNAAGRRAADRASYGGWQNGALFLQTAPGVFSESAWLRGSAIPADTRNAVPIDVGADGRMDLAVTTFEEWPQRRQRVLILRNQTPVPGNWIGFESARLSGDCRIRIRAGGVVHERRLMTGESYRSQSTGRIHIGLGRETRVESAELLLDGGPGIPIPSIQPNRWNPIPAGENKRAGGLEAHRP